MKIWTDGSGWNGETSGYAIVFDMGRTAIVVREPVNKTNNEREYQAIIEALKLAHQDTIISDSQLCVFQINGIWKVKEKRLLPLCFEARRLLEEKQCALVWERRDTNQAGFLLERK
jgi:ribonuclease HI